MRIIGKLGNLITICSRRVIVLSILTALGILAVGQVAMFETPTSNPVAAGAGATSVFSGHSRCWGYWPRRCVYIP